MGVSEANGITLGRAGLRDAREKLTRRCGGAEKWKTVMEFALANGITHSPTGEQNDEKCGCQKDEAENLLWM